MSKYVNFGHACQIKLPEKPINCSRLGYFDELEEECWHLVKQYCATFGIELMPQEDGEAPISFDIAKGIQDYILETPAYGSISKRRKRTKRKIPHRVCKGVKRRVGTRK